jgi:radical SAM superfamily enzyme YgiQ (UPF0313 family)
MMIEGERILEDIPGLDYAVVGDGEDAIVELCGAIQGRRSLAAIDGLIRRDGGKVVRNKDRSLSSDIDGLAFPDYEPFGVESIRSYQIITSRGCPHSCSYCFRSTRKWRPRSPENIVRELKAAAAKYKIKEFAVVDDAFNILPERVHELCRLLRAEGLGLPWMCSGARPDRMTDALAKDMREAGCYGINIGVETLQEDVYAGLNRNMPLEKVVECARILKKYGFVSQGYFMIGLPGDTKDKTWDTYKKAKALGLGRQGFSIMLPFPGTKMHDAVCGTPGVRRLADYRTVSTIWTFSPEYSRMATAFETPEYPAKDKIEMYNKLRTMEGDPRPPYHRSLLLFGLHAMLWVFKYDLRNSPRTLFKLGLNFLRRVVSSKGRHVYMTEIVYKRSFIEAMKKGTP